MHSCQNCGDAHFIQQCPEIARALFAPIGREPWKDIALGRELHMPVTVEGVVDDSLRGAFFAVPHQAIDELCHQQRVIARLWA